MPLDQASPFSSLPAEKVTSLGKDWHRPCLRCERCSKTLTPGGHAEVRGLGLGWAQWGNGEGAGSTWSLGQALVG
jgi:hypothetical protein